MASQLWLLRHGDAEPHGTRPDSERRLTERGERQARAAGEALARLGIEFAEVLTSPKVRARDTARLAAAAWGGEPEPHQPLAEGFDARDARDLLASAEPGARILVVGHEPDLSRTVAELTGARVDFKKGGLAAVSIDGSSSELVVLMRPRELSHLAGLPAAAL
jgi:phosphohistidine phosphatase